MVSLPEEDIDGVEEHVLVAYTGSQTCIYRFTAEYARVMQKIIGGHVLNNEIRLPTDVSHILNVFLTMIEDPEWVQGIAGMPLSWNPRRSLPVKHFILR